jgi:uncharacterized protein
MLSFRIRSATILLSAMIVRPVDAQTAAQPPAPPSYGKSRTVDLISKSTGASHRLRIIKPNGDPPAAGFPVIYLLDGTWYFDLVVEAATVMTRSRDMQPSVIVGVGYEDGLEARRLRVRDFTTPAPADLIPPHFVAWKAEPGGAERFMHFMSDEVKPMMAAETRINGSCQILIGHSLGGLFAVESLFRDPAGYSTYVIGDPSVWWNASEVLKGEASLAKKLNSIPRPIRVLLARSTVPNTGLGIAKADTVFARLKSPSFMYSYKSYDGDTHNSMLPGFMATALQATLKCE